MDLAAQAEATEDRLAALQASLALLEKKIGEMAWQAHQLRAELAKLTSCREKVR